MISNKIAPLIFFDGFLLHMKKADKKRIFREELLGWNREKNDRQMPWKGEKDPYRIWLSEIILQQTRVEQGLGYYQRFIKTFPTIHDLAAAPETAVFKLWEGLGYYSRCKNLLATARYISDKLKGKFPNRYEDILKLKGIGPYTAAAIASFAFNLPHAVVDGNVFRVLSRYFGMDTPIDSTAGKKSFTQLANELIDQQWPGIYNQALMDFGATVCKPQQPACASCPLQSYCEAYKKGIVNSLPVKEKQITKKTRWLYYLVISHKNKLLVRKRGKGDIWENLYEFVLMEEITPLDPDKLHQHPFLKKIFKDQDFKIGSVSENHRQLLTHQVINGCFIELKASRQVSIPGYDPVPAADLSNLPFPKLISGYLNNKKMYL